MPQSSESSKDPNSLKLPDHEYSARKITPDELEQLLRQFDEAMETIDAMEKKAYLKAKNQARHVVDLESPPLQFIRYCGGDLWAAAEQLCTYWKFRFEIFGERALLPLNLTGRGALTKSDILCLQGGYPAILPQAKDGQQVTLIDRRTWTSRTTMENKLRCIFYIGFVLAQDEKAQTEGVFIVIILLTPRLQGWDPQWLKYGWKFARTAIPVKAKPLGVCLLPKSGDQSLFQGMFSSFVASLVQGGFPINRATMLVEEEESKIRDSLLAAGLTLEGIPTSLGGEYQMEATLQWVLDHARQQKAISGNQRRTRHTATPKTKQTPRATSTATAARKKRGRTDEEQRTANAIHSRRKRERRHRELQAMKDEHEKSVQENISLKAEKARLEGLLKQVKEVTEHSHVLPQQHQPHLAVECVRQGRQMGGEAISAAAVTATSFRAASSNCSSVGKVRTTAGRAFGHDRQAQPLGGEQMFFGHDRQANAKNDKGPQPQDCDSSDEELENLMVASMISSSAASVLSSSAESVTSLSSASIISSSLLDEIGLEAPSISMQPGQPGNKKNTKNTAKPSSSEPCAATTTTTTTTAAAATPLVDIHELSSATKMLEAQQVHLERQIDNLSTTIPLSCRRHHHHGGSATTTTTTTTTTWRPAHNGTRSGGGNHHHTPSTFPSSSR